MNFYYFFGLSSSLKKVPNPLYIRLFTPSILPMALAAAGLIFLVTKHFAIPEIFIFAVYIQALLWSCFGQGLGLAAFGLANKLIFFIDSFCPFW
jgi:hypothetical protein